MNGYWVALAAAGGTLIGYLVAIAVVGVSHAENENRLAEELAAARRQLAGAREVYDWAQERDDAAEFSARMISELASEVGSLRAVCYEAVAWIESLPQVGYRVSDVDALRIRLRAVLEDVEALEEAR